MSVAARSHACSGRCGEEARRGVPLIRERHSVMMELVKEKKVIVPAGETVILPRPPSSTVSMTYTVEGDEEVRVRIRELEGREGEGFVLNPAHSPFKRFGPPLGAIFAMEAENLSDSDAWIIATFE